jgi:hypothetical protein
MMLTMILVADKKALQHLMGKLVCTDLEVEVGVWRLQRMSSWWEMESP